MADLAEPSRGGHVGSSPLASIAVVGGSGFYEFLEDAEEVAVDTPFGAPSDPITVGEVAGRRVAFLPRHGRDHRFPPHKIPYRANLWALRSIGVRRVLAPTAVGSLTPSYGPGTLAFPDQLVDRTRTRVQTYYDVGACHVPFADPYCPSVRSAAIATAREQGWVPVSSGTLDGDRRPVLPVVAFGPHRHGPGAGLGTCQLGHPGSYRGPALLHPRRVAVVCRPGLDAG